MFDIKCESKDFISIDKLTEFQGELKHRDEADISKIVKSIKKHGFCFPFFVWKHDGINHVFDGHGRLLALKWLQSQGEEIPELPCVYINAKNEAEAKELLLKLNSNYGKMTQESVLEFLDGLQIDFEDIALPDSSLNFDIEQESEETEGDDEVPEVQEEAVSKPGEIYELGNSLLMCGDSTKEEDVSRLMGGAMADMVFTDPPYNTGMTKEKSRDSTRLNHFFDDSFTDEEWETFMESFCNMYERYLKSDTVAYICLDWRRNHELIPHIKKHFKLSNIIVWDKVVHGLGSDYKYTYELINVCKKGNPNLNTHQGEKEYQDVWHIQRKMGHDEDHATKKPLEICERAIKHGSKMNDLILDLFGGSGSTLIACEKLNRKSRLMELEPKYCDVIRRRYTQWAKENGRPITSGCLE